MSWAVPVTVGPGDASKLAEEIPGAAFRMCGAGLAGRDDHDLCTRDGAQGGPEHRHGSGGAGADPRGSRAGRSRRGRTKSYGVRLRCSVLREAWPTRKTRCRIMVGGVRLRTTLFVRSAVPRPRERDRSLRALVHALPALLAEALGDDRDFRPPAAMALRRADRRRSRAQPVHFAGSTTGITSVLHPEPPAAAVVAVRRARTASPT